MATQKITSTTFDGSGDQAYDIAKLVYPIDLLENGTSNKYNGNRVVFFINVNESSKSKQNSGSLTRNFKLYDIPQSDLKAASGKQVSTAAKNIPIVGKVRKRLAAAIVLHMPIALNQDTSVSWSEDDLDNLLGNAVSVISASAESYKGEKGFFGGLWAGTKTATNAGGSLAAKALLKGAGDTGNAITRVTPGNTRAEQLFKKVNFRSFVMNYSFAPKSEAEAENVMAIIRMFKHHMLPEYKDEATFLFLYPSDFNIKYYVGPKENQYIEKQLTCVLNSVSINYAPNGIFTTFPNGMPQQIDFSMSFTETALPTKESSPFDRLGV